MKKKKKRRRRRRRRRKRISCFFVTSARCIEHITAMEVT
jgi:hypothetical protein